MLKKKYIGNDIIKIYLKYCYNRNAFEMMLLDKYIGEIIPWENNSK